MKKYFIALIAFGLVSTFFAQPQNSNKDSITIAGILNSHPGAFVMFDKKENKYFRFNQTRCAQRFLPASTFKILNSLIGLETGVITDENYLIKWDGIKRWSEEWNKDHTLATAIKFSVVPYYQELARRVEKKLYKEFLSGINYGNKLIGKKVDRFWLDNSLKISADEQIEFLKHFYNYELSFSKRNVDIVKNIIPEEKYPNSILKFKTGSGTKENGTYIGWFVGYVEKQKNTFFFAFNVEAKTFEEVSKLRDSTSRKILTELKIIE